MHSEPDAKALKRSALDLLASGNGMESVAHVLGVSVAAVEDWSREGPATRPMADAATAPPSTSEHGRHPCPHVEPTGFFPNRPATKVVLIGVPVALTALVVSSYLDETFKDASLFGCYRVIMGIGLLIGVYLVAYALRAGFELTRDAVVFQDAFTSRELAFADIEYYRVMRNKNLGVYTLSLYPRSGGRRMTIWFDSEQVRDPNIAGWIASLPRVGPGTVSTLPSSASSQTKESDAGRLGMFWVGYVLLTCLVVGALFVANARPFIDSMRLIMQGPLPKILLDTTQGTLLKRGPCVRNKFGNFQSLQIDTGVMIVDRSIPCLIGPHDLAPATEHRVAIFTDNRRFAAGDIYEIDLDGRPLLSYAKHVTEKRDGATSEAVISVIGMFLGEVALVSFAVGLLSRRR